MNFNPTKILYRAGGFLHKNAATILTCIGAAGVVATAVMTAKATPKAIMLIDVKQHKKEEPLTRLEKACAAAPAYIPPVIVGVSTVACIFGANALNKRQQAALMSAYALLSSSYSEYRNKVNDIYGVDADDTVKTAIAEEKYKSSEFKPSKENTLVFYEEYYGDFFEASESDVYYALYHFNRNFQLRGYATVAELHEFLEIQVKESDKAIGWSLDGFYDSGLVPWVDFDFIKKTLDDGMVYYVICPQWDASTEYLKDYI